MADDVIGVAFPEVEGNRSSTATGQAVFAAAARAVDPQVADAIEREDDWYGSYVEHALALEQAQADDPQGAQSVPEAGLRSLYEQMEFVRDGETTPVPDAFERAREAGFETIDVDGTRERDDEVRVPYRGRILTGDDLRRQLDEWTVRDMVEPSFAAAIGRTIDNPAWLDLSDRTMVVLGGAAEMGPLEWLARWGATTVVVDLPEPDLWRRILSTVREGAGRALIPAREPLPGEPADERIAEVAGADLITALPEVAAWLDRLEGPLTVGNYVYAHGSINVEVSTAVDAIADRLLARGDDRSVAVLATPTDVYTVPPDAVAASQRRFRERTSARRTIGRLSGQRLFAPNYPENDGGRRPDQRRVVDCQISQQGCNYSLAKRLHRWRARLARQRGAVSSINVAPATNTKSVTDNRVLKACYSSAAAYDVEVFEPETSRALMALLLVHDLREPSAAANPDTALEHPSDLLSEAACHGGLWRIPFAPRTVLPLAAIRGMAHPATWRG
ncbi:MAG: hypothetical protein R3343_05515 [Nitriliruptorales bacterium]|nr:hypothetical protein [Nitriliruptorales bacterium]